MHEFQCHMVLGDTQNFHRTKLNITIFDKKQAVCLMSNGLTEKSSGKNHQIIVFRSECFFLLVENVFSSCNRLPFIKFQKKAMGKDVHKFWCVLAGGPITNLKHETKFARHTQTKKKESNFYQRESQSKCQWQTVHIFGYKIYICGCEKSP